MVENTASDVIDKASADLTLALWVLAQPYRAVQNLAQSKCVSNSV
jgi:hypothetical protein